MKQLITEVFLFIGVILSGAIFTLLIG